MTQLTPKKYTPLNLTPHQNVQPKGDTYIRTVSKGSIEGLLTWGKQILDII